MCRIRRAAWRFAISYTFSIFTQIFRIRYCLFWNLSPIERVQGNERYRNFQTAWKMHFIRKVAFIDQFHPWTVRANTHWNSNVFLLKISSLSLFRFILQTSISINSSHNISASIFSSFYSNKVQFSFEKFFSTSWTIRAVYYRVCNKQHS